MLPENKMAALYRQGNKEKETVGVFTKSVDTTAVFVLNLVFIFYIFSFLFNVECGMIEGVNITGCDRYLQE